MDSFKIPVKVYTSDSIDKLYRKIFAGKLNWEYDKLIFNSVTNDELTTNLHSYTRFDKKKETFMEVKYEIDESVTDNEIWMVRS